MVGGWLAVEDIPGTFEGGHPYVAVGDGKSFVVYETPAYGDDFEGQINLRWRCTASGVWNGPSVVDVAAGRDALAIGSGHSWAPIAFDATNEEIDIAYVSDHDDESTTPTVMVHAKAPLTDFGC